MPDRPPVAPRVAQPPGKTYLNFSPDGQRMLVAGCANYARSFRTNDEGEPDLLDRVVDDTLAVACGVSQLSSNLRPLLTGAERLCNSGG